MELIYGNLAMIFPALSFPPVGNPAFLRMGRKDAGKAGMTIRRSGGRC